MLNNIMVLISALFTGGMEENFMPIELKEKMVVNRTKFET